MKPQRRINSKRKKTLKILHDILSIMEHGAHLSPFLSLIDLNDAVFDNVSLKKSSTPHQEKNARYFTETIQSFIQHQFQRHIDVNNLHTAIFTQADIIEVKHKAASCFISIAMQQVKNASNKTVASSQIIASLQRLSDTSRQAIEQQLFSKLPETEVSEIAYSLFEQLINIPPFNLLSLIPYISEDDADNLILYLRSIHTTSLWNLLQQNSIQNSLITLIKHNAASTIKNQKGNDLLNLRTGLRSHIRSGATLDSIVKTMVYCHALLSDIDNMSNSSFIEATTYLVKQHPTLQLNSLDKLYHDSKLAYLHHPGSHCVKIMILLPLIVKSKHENFNDRHVITANDKQYTDEFSSLRRFIPEDSTSIFNELRAVPLFIHTTNDTDKTYSTFCKQYQLIKCSHRVNNKPTFYFSSPRCIANLFNSATHIRETNTHATVSLKGIIFTSHYMLPLRTSIQGVPDLRAYSSCSKKNVSAPFFEYRIKQLTSTNTYMRASTHTLRKKAIPLEQTRQYISMIVSDSVDLFHQQKPARANPSKRKDQSSNTLPFSSLLCVDTSCTKEFRNNDSPPNTPS